MKQYMEQCIVVVVVLHKMDAAGSPQKHGRQIADKLQGIL